MSLPFVDPVTGKAAAALTVPVLNSDGTIHFMLSEVLDVSSPDVLAPLAHAKDLGNTGHAVLVAEGGVVIASTDDQGFLQPGEHLDFYMRMLRARASGVENVPENEWSRAGAGLDPQTGEHHVMAFAPLSAAPWGIAVGGSAGETLAPVARLRSTLLLAGALSLALLWALTLVAARLLVRPVQTLTSAARGMASGDLAHPVRVREAGRSGSWPRA